MLLAQKYAPKKLEDILGNLTPKKQLKRWMLTWMRGTRQLPLLICGPPGIGKTAMVHALRDELGLQLVEMGASDFRDRENVDKIIGGTMSAATLSGKQKLVLIDDVDAMGREDSGGTAAIAGLLKECPLPLILTAQDSWDKKVRPLRGYCTIVSLKRPIAPSIAKLLKHIASEEKMGVAESAIVAIAENAHGDIRAAINDLHASVVGERDRKKDIFSRLAALFRAQKYSEARQASFGDIEHNLLKLWVDENIPAALSPSEVPSAYNMLSRADIFDGRIIRRQAWGFLRYSGDLMTAGVSFSRLDSRPKFARYQFPSYLKKMKATSSFRALMKSILTKIGRKMHTSPKRAESYLPVFAGFYAQDPEYFEANYGFDSKEGEFLMGISPKVRRAKPSGKARAARPAVPGKDAGAKDKSKKEAGAGRKGEGGEGANPGRVSEPKAGAPEKGSRSKGKNEPGTDAPLQGDDAKEGGGSGVEKPREPAKPRHDSPKLHEFF